VCQLHSVARQNNSPANNDGLPINHYCNSWRLGVHVGPLFDEVRPPLPLKRTLIYTRGRPKAEVLLSAEAESRPKVT